MRLSRRGLLRSGALRLATVGTGAWILRADAQATESSGEAGDYLNAMERTGERPVPAAAGPDDGVPPQRVGPWTATEDNILGPFYRPGAPYRAKITPPREPGDVLVIHGRVWGLDTRRPLAGAVLDIWQANADGRYDNDDPRRPPAKGVYRNRARLVADETGSYEFESILPGPYRIGPEIWRPRHIHYLVRHPGYAELVTQLYFQGDPHNRTDPFIKPSLIIDLADAGTGDRRHKTGAFDIVLAPGASGR
jgi:catechol 1,2-dioxygenase